MLGTEQQEQIRWALTTLSSRQKEYRLHLAYYRGAHRLMIAEERLRKVFGDFFSDFRMNICGPVVDCLADRLEVQSFSTPGEDEANESVADVAGEIWKKNRMSRRAKELHKTAIAGGDAFAIVWPDPAGFPVIYPNSPLEVCVEYDAERPGRILRAAKLWKVDEKGGRSAYHCLTLYYPDRIEKYQTDAGSSSSLGLASFKPRETPGEAWPLVNQYGKVPVFPFTNRSDLGEAGTSELRDALPMQDGLNKSIFDMLVSGEFQAYPQRYALNIEIKRDSEGVPINPFKAGPERVWVLEGGEKTNLGQFAAADQQKMLSVKQDWSLSMAQVTQTPPHYFMLPSGLVSGESQKTAEQKLDVRVEDRTTTFGDSWSELMALALEMYSFGALGGVEVDCNWADTKPRNEKEVWEIAEKKRGLGVSNDQILREQGYSQDQIDQFKQERGDGQELEPVPKDEALEATPVE